MLDILVRHGWGWSWSLLRGVAFAEDEGGAEADEAEEEFVAPKTTGKSGVSSGAMKLYSILAIVAVLCFAAVIALQVIEMKDYIPLWPVK